MSRKPKRGYFVRGQFVAEGSELDLKLQAELKGDKPSRTEQKRESDELQKLGTELLELGRARRDALLLGGKLEEALDAAHRISDFEGRRRQVQFIGKLMRGIEPELLERIRAAVRDQHQGSAEDTELLHRAQRWRDELIADDARLAPWLEQQPQTDVQQLRTLIRQARKDAAAQAKAPRGEAPRHGRAYRDIYQLVRQQISAAASTDGSDGHAAIRAEARPTAAT